MKKNKLRKKKRKNPLRNAKVKVKMKNIITKNNGKVKATNSE